MGMAESTGQIRDNMANQILSIPRKRRESLLLCSFDQVCLDEDFIQPAQAGMLQSSLADYEKIQIAVGTRLASRHRPGNHCRAHVTHRLPLDRAYERRKASLWF